MLKAAKADWKPKPARAEILGEEGLIAKTAAPAPAMKPLRSKIRQGMHDVQAAIV